MRMGRHTYASLAPPAARQRRGMLPPGPGTPSLMHRAAAALVRRQPPLAQVSLTRGGGRPWPWPWRLHASAAQPPSTDSRGCCDALLRPPAVPTSTLHRIPTCLEVPPPGLGARLLNLGRRHLRKHSEARRIRPCRTLPARDALLTSRRPGRAAAGLRPEGSTSGTFCGPGRRRATGPAPRRLPWGPARPAAATAPPAASPARKSCRGSRGPALGGCGSTGSWFWQGRDAGGRGCSRAA